MEARYWSRKDSEFQESAALAECCEHSDRMYADRIVPAARPQDDLLADLAVR